MTSPANTDAGLPVTCQCGRISFTTPPASTMTGLAHCHCTDCRKQSASAYGTSAWFPADKVFPLPADVEEKIAIYERVADSGNQMHCYFCPKCGVRVIHSRYDEGKGGYWGRVSFKGGCVEGLDWGKAIHIFTRSKVVQLPEGAVAYETYPPGI